MTQPRCDHCFRRSRQRGNAALELILILPMYMLILYIVVAMGEYGQVATQIYQASRLQAWSNQSEGTYPNTKSTKGTVSSPFFDHFGPRASVQGGSRMIEPMHITGQKSPGLPIGQTGAGITEGASSFPFMSYFADPLRSNGPAIGYYSSLDSNATPNLRALVKLALDGDRQVSHTDAVPWLRRQYATCQAKYTPIDKFIDSAVFRTFTTVLRPVLNFSAQHAPYTIPGQNGGLRWLECSKIPDGRVAMPHDKLHQMDFLGVDPYLDPARPEP